MQDTRYKMQDKVLFIDLVHPLILKELTAHGFECDYFPHFSRQDTVRIIDQYFGLIIRSKIKVDKEILDKASSLRFIGRVGSGMENIDVDYAVSKGIVCMNSPEGNRDAVGEHTLGMLLSLINHMNRADRQVRQGKWIKPSRRTTVWDACGNWLSIRIIGSTVAPPVIISWIPSRRNERTHPRFHRHTFLQPG